MKFIKYVSVLTLLFLVGCTTAQSPTTVNRLQIQVAQLERKIDERDREIQSLQNEVNSLSREVDSVESSSRMRRPVVPVFEDDYDSSSSSSSASDNDERIIRVSASVKDVQKALKNAGYYNGKIDGKLGPQSKSGIKDFQSGHGLKADGIVGRKTWSELQNYLQ